MRHVTVVGLPKVLGTSITIPMEMLHAADLIHRIGGAAPALQMQLVSPDGGNIALTAGLELACATPLHAVEATDLIIVPALWGNPVSMLRRHPQLLEWLHLQHERNTSMCAVGTGSFFLAEAGLLHQKVATTHWYYFDHFARLYPDVLLQRERFITRAGNLYCAGSVNSVRDVMLHFIEEHYGATTANQVSRHFTHEVKRSYTSNFLKQAPQHYHEDETIVAIQDWMHNEFHTAMTLDAIAQRFGLSVRSLNRRFRHATGRSPMQYLQQVRMDSAKELLRSTNLSVAEVAYACGYADNGYFSAQFRRSISLSPRAYRDLVRRKLFQVNRT